jgi:hypothetical protein
MKTNGGVCKKNGELLYQKRSRVQATIVNCIWEKGAEEGAGYRGSESRMETITKWGAFNLYSATRIVTMMKSRRAWWAVHVACIKCVVREPLDMRVLTEMGTIEMHLKS